jgi:1-acyl-sn-glycerol-3-phosphate acyltransferase
VADPDAAPTGWAAVRAELRGLVGDVRHELAAAGRPPLRDAVAEPLRVAAAAADAVGLEWEQPLAELVGFVRSRLTGDHAVDDFGFDADLTERVFLPLLRPLVRHWFRVEVRGAENLPAEGAALLVSNHAGTLPLDGMVLQSVVFDATGRHVRLLGADLIFAVFPEGFKGLGKRYADRYQLQRFGRGGFVSAAVRGQVPIVPVSVVGSEEIYPLLATVPLLARALGVPYVPVTPLFPWLGPLGLVPLPSKWVVQFGEAITTDELPAGAAEDPVVVFSITDQVRETIQQTLYALLVQRRGVFG